jgi:Uma2 family endonuclease
MTEEQFVEWCDEDVRAEFVDGEVIVLSPEMKWDERIRWFVGQVLGIFVRERELGEVFGPNYQTRLRTGLRRVPDLLFVSRERSQVALAGHLEGPPDATFEIVSRGSVTRDVRDKFYEYQKAGVREYWLIMPLEQKVEVYHLNPKGRYEPLPLTEGDYHSTVIEGFFLRPEWLWQEPLPNPLDILGELGILPARRSRRKNH